MCLVGDVAVCKCGWPRNDTTPTIIGTVLYGGEEAELERGSLVSNTLQGDSRHKRWRVMLLLDDDRLELLLSDRRHPRRRAAAPVQAATKEADDAVPDATFWRATKEASERHLHGKHRALATPGCRVAV